MIWWRAVEIWWEEQRDQGQLDDICREAQKEWWSQWSPMSQGRPKRRDPGTRYVECHNQCNPRGFDRLSSESIPYYPNFLCWVKMINPKSEPFTTTKQVTNMSGFFGIPSLTKCGRFPQYPQVIRLQCDSIETSMWRMMITAPKAQNGGLAPTCEVSSDQPLINHYQVLQTMNGHRNSWYTHRKNGYSP